MKQITNFDELNGFIDHFLQNSVSPAFIRNRNKRLELLKDAIKREKALLKRRQTSGRDETVLQITAGFLKRFEKLIGQLDEECEKNKIPKVVCDLAEPIDKTITLPQEEERFHRLPENGRFQVIGKWGKRVARNIQRGSYRIFNLLGFTKQQPSPWKQEIPLRPVICYVMAVDRERYRKWFQHDLHLYYNILKEYKNVLSKWLEQDIHNLNLTEEQENRLIENWQQLFDEQLSQIERKQEAFQTEMADFTADQNKKLKALLTVAGTIEGANNSFYSNHSPELLQQLDEQLTAMKNKYLKAERAYLNEIDVLVDFAVMGNKLLERLHKAEVAVEELFNNSALNNVQTLRDELSRLIANIPEQKNMKAAGERIAAAFEDKIIAPLNKEYSQNRISSMEEDLSGDVMLIVSELPDELKVAQIQFDEEGEMRCEEQTYELNKLVARFFKENTLRPLKKKTDEFRAKQQTLIEHVSQAKDIVEVSLATAAESEHGEEGASESPQTIAENGLKRAVDKLNEVAEATENPFSELKNTMTDEYSLLLHHVRKQTLHELQWKDKEYQVRGRAQDWKLQLQVKWAKLEDDLAVWFRFATRKFKKWFSKVAPWIGYSEGDKKSSRKLYLTTYLAKTEEDINRLPSIYKRLFDTSQIADKRFYLGNPGAVSKFKNAFEAWKENIHSSFALVGERGSGKTSFVHRIDDEFTPGTEVHYISLDKLVYTKKHLLNLLAETFDLHTGDEIKEYIKQLKQLSGRRVVVVDNIHDMYIRNMHGFEALETFLLIVSQTKAHILWAVTASRYAWCYLDKVLNVSDYFSHISVCDALDGEQISQLILSRHKASGYELEFVADEDISSSRLYKKHLGEREALQNYLQKIFFRNLADVARGNASVAMSFWLRSIKEFDEQKMVIQPVSYTSLSDIEDVFTENLFTLSALVLHDNLSVDELAMATNLEKDQCRLILSRLHSKGILVRYDQQFKLNDLIYRQTIRFLEQRNVIHLNEV